MTESEQVEKIMSLGTTKKKGWQKSDNPCLSADYGDVEKAWRTITAKMDTEAKEELIKTIELAVRAQAIFRKDSRLAGDFVPQPKLIASWLRKKRWKDTIESHAELKNKQDNNCKCGKPSVIRYKDGKWCSDCYGKRNPDSRAIPLPTVTDKQIDRVKAKVRSSTFAKHAKDLLRGMK